MTIEEDNDQIWIRYQYAMSKFCLNQVLFNCIRTLDRYKNKCIHNQLQTIKINYTYNTSARRISMGY